MQVSNLQMKTVGNRGVCSTGGIRPEEVDGGKYHNFCHRLTDRHGFIGPSRVGPKKAGSIPPISCIISMGHIRVLNIENLTLRA